MQPKVTRADEGSCGEEERGKDKERKKDRKTREGGADVQVCIAIKNRSEKKKKHEDTISENENTPCVALL